MYKILSLDGGGTWAVLQLLTLQSKYGDINGHEVLRHFDLVIANSGGSLVLAALCENKSLSESIDIYKVEANRKLIFQKNSFKEKFFPVDYLQLMGLKIGPKYSAEKKRKAFEVLFPVNGGKSLKDLPEVIGKHDLRLIICTYNAYENRAKFFKSYSDQGESDSIDLIEAVHGSTNAPVQYFDFPARFKALDNRTFYELWDGALGGFNNPVVAGIVEALRLKVKSEDIKAISLGSGDKIISRKDQEEFYKLRFNAMRYRLDKWALSKLKYQFGYFKQSVMQQATSILYEPPEWSNFVAHMILSKGMDDWDPAKLIRMSPLIYIKSDFSDDIKSLLSELYAMDMDATKESEITLLFEFFEAWQSGKIFNQPIDYRLTRDHELIYLSGQKTFQEALSKW